MTRRTSLLLVILAAFAWRVHALAQQSLWRDEVDAIYFATRELSETLRMFLSPGQNGPLYFLALRPWFGWVGSSEFALRYPSAMAGTLGVVLVWQVGRTLLPLRPASVTQFRGRQLPGNESISRWGRAVMLSGTKHLSAATGDPRETLRSAQGDKPRKGASTHAPIPKCAPGYSFPAAQDGAALLAALFFAFNPYQLWYSQEGKMYTLITVLVLPATWWWLEGISRGGLRPWPAYWLAVTLGMYTHLLLILLFPLHLFWFVSAWPAARSHWRGYGLALAGLTLPYLPMVWWQWHMLTAGVKLTGFSFTPLDEMARSLLYNHSRGFMPPDDLAWIAPLFFLGGAGVVLGVGELAAHTPHTGLTLVPWRRFALLLSWLLLPVAGIYGLSLRQPIFTDRYVIWIAPALMLLLALGVVVVYRHAGALGRLFAAALVVYVVGFWLYAGWQQKTESTKYDLRGGVTYIAARRSPEALLILQIPHMEYAYRYYTSDFGPRPFTGSDARLGAWMGGLWTNHGRPDEAAQEDVDRQMRRQTAGHSDVWVMRSEVEMWDQRHLMDAWLQQHGTLVEQADFHGVQVRRYRLAP